MANEKVLIGIVVVAVILLIAGSFLGGFFIARSRSLTAIREAEDTIDNLTTRLTSVDSELKSARTEIQNLRGLQSADRDTIERLRGRNRELGETVSKQGDIISELRKQGSIVGDASSSIETGLGEAVETVEGIIKFIQEGKD